MGVRCFRHLFLRLQVFHSLPDIFNPSPHHFKCFNYLLVPHSISPRSFTSHFASTPWLVCVQKCFMRLKGLRTGLWSAQTSFVFSPIGSNTIYLCCLSGAPNVKSTWEKESVLSVFCSHTPSTSLPHHKQQREWVTCHRRKEHQQILSFPDLSPQ